MRILLAANASYAPPRGGSTWANLAWLRALAESGHECRVVAQGSAPPDGPISLVTADSARLGAVLREEIETFLPDWVLVSSEDLGQALLREALDAAPGRVVYLAHTPQMFPFGPVSLNPNPRGAELVARAAAVVAICRFTANYIRHHTGLKPAVVHPPIYGEGPFRNLGCFEHGRITMINPCAVKGIAIFLELAKRFPELEFGALPGWGTTARDRTALAALPNVRLFDSSPDIEDILSKTKVLLMPSLWPEGFGLIAMEAMLRGIPVISSDLGGLAEAKNGTGFVMPVRPIERYRTEFDENRMPIPEVPEQDAGPWESALRELVSDRDVYRGESERSREAALRFVSNVHAGDFEAFLRTLETPPMRILLAQNSLYYPAHGGGDKSNRLLLEALAARGHACRVVARVHTKFGPEQHARFLEELAARRVPVRSDESGVVRFEHNRVDIHAVAGNPNMRGVLARQIEEFAPEIILVSTDDPAQLLLEVALDAPRARVVFLARTTLALPFGPECAFESAAKTEMLRRAAGCVGVSRYVSEYIRRWSGIPAAALPISLMEPGPWPHLGRFENEFVTMVNPCAVKGLPIFLALAERMPEVRFAAVPIWGTTASDLEALRRLRNVELLEPVDNIDDLLRRTRVLLVPSLWAEARSRIVVEALLRGVPVLAANSGGIPEAMMGLDYLLPVRHIEKYQARVDEQMVPVADVPPQEIGPWHDALAGLLEDRARYERLSQTSRDKARQYADRISAVPLERYLASLRAAPQQTLEPTAREQPAQRPLDGLSPERRALLALRLRKKQSAPAKGEWFAAEDIARPAALRLFCFPYAGGGASIFRDWGACLPRAVSLCPVRLPGRETRAAEPFFDSVPAAVEAIAQAIVPFTNTPFALFGHSMGAAIAFELARYLRRHGHPVPAALFVSGARAPQFRLGYVAGPESDEMERLRILLPALEADTAVCRTFAYVPEPPLDCAIRAYGGINDPNVQRHHLEAWREQTTASFGLRLFPGRHFFLHTAQAEFLAALAADLEG